MTPRMRTIIGTVALLIYMGFYALLVMTIAVAKILDKPHSLQAIYFLVAGILWAFPAMPLIKWMSKKS